MYIPTIQSSYAFVAATKEDDNPMGQKLSISFARAMPEMMRKLKTPPVSVGYLQAWDPVNQKEVWRVADRHTVAAGGTLATAGGLVFAGNSKNEFVAYRADTTVEKLWAFDAQTGVMAGPGHLRSRRRAVRGGRRRFPPDGQLLRAQLLARAGVQAGRDRDAAGRGAVPGTGAESRLPRSARRQ